MPREDRSQRSAPRFGDLELLGAKPRSGGVHELLAAAKPYTPRIDIEKCIDFYEAGRAYAANHPEEMRQFRAAQQAAFTAPLEAKIDVLNAKVDTLTNALNSALAALQAATGSGESSGAPEPVTPPPVNVNNVVNVNVDVTAIPCERGHVEDYEADDGTILIDITKKDPPN